jgi:hypothetical protein
MSRTVRKMSDAPKKMGRSAEALSACLRHAGPMHDRRAPRGGAHNETRELWEAYENESEETLGLVNDESDNPADDWE